MKANNKEIVTALTLLVISMLTLSFASVPIYNLFCKATGFGGTVQQKTVNSSKKGSRQITINFDSNVAPGLPWKFIPKQKSITVTTGTNSLVFYHLHNISNKDVVGTAIYNVTPNKAGRYFVKIYCFCFEEQIVKKNDEMLMPVSFYIDPAIEDDPYMKDVHTITLSYSFFKIRDH